MHWSTSLLSAKLNHLTVKKMKYYGMILYKIKPFLLILACLHLLLGLVTFIRFLSITLFVVENDRRDEINVNQS